MKLHEGRAPQGARGLKYAGPNNSHRVAMSRPARGAWIEIGTIAGSSSTISVAPRKGRVD